MQIFLNNFAFQLFCIVTRVDKRPLNTESQLNEIMEAIRVIVIMRVLLLSDILNFRSSHFFLSLITELIIYQAIYSPLFSFRDISY